MLYTGGHTRIFEFLKHAEDATATAPSHVVKIDPNTGETEDVLVNLDNSFATATVGAATKDRLFVGSVFEDIILDCPFKLDASPGCAFNESLTVWGDGRGDYSNSRKPRRNLASMAVAAWL